MAFLKKRLTQAILLALLLVLTFFALHQAGQGAATRLGGEDYGLTAQIRQAEDVAIYYGVSSYTMFGTDANSLQELIGYFSDLRLIPTEQEQELIHTLMIYFVQPGQEDTGIWLDKNGVFSFGDPRHCYVAVDGSSPYEAVYQIYRQSE